jgi:hypothetical protein
VGGFLKVEDLANGKTFDLLAKYLIGADGGGSFVLNKLMGAKQAGNTLIRFLGGTLTIITSQLSASWLGGWKLTDSQTQQQKSFIGIIGCQV